MQLPLTATLPGPRNFIEGKSPLWDLFLCIHAQWSQQRLQSDSLCAEMGIVTFGGPLQSRVVHISRVVADPGTAWT